MHAEVIDLYQFFTLSSMNTLRIIFSLITIFSFNVLSLVNTHSQTSPSYKKIQIVTSNNKQINDYFYYLPLPSSLNKPEFQNLKQFVHQEYGENALTEPLNFLRIMDWVSSRWVHDGSISSSTMNSLEILKAAKSGRNFSCIEYAKVMSDILTTHGYISRVVGITTSNIAYGSIGEGHAVSEVWSNTLRKWIFIDPQFSIHAKYKGQFLNFYEMYDLKKRGKYNDIEFEVSESYCRVNRRDRKDIIKEYKEFLSQYFSYMMIDILKDGKSILLIYGLDGKDQFLTSQGGNGKTSIFTDNIHDMYFDLNQTTILFDFNIPTLDCSTIVQKYDIKNRQDYLSKMSEFASVPDFTLSFTTNTPWFSHYEVKHDEKSDWKTIQSINNYQWKLHDGMNEIHVRSVNQSGIYGVITKMQIQYQE
jgi:hypothetical protein